MSNATDNPLIAQYEAAFTEAVDKLGAPKEGHVWLYRAEHLKQIPADQIDTTNYPDNLRDTVREAVGRWYGDRLSDRFQHLERYVHDESHEGIDTVTISALQVPIGLAARCHMAQVAPPPDGEEFSLLQKARTTSRNPEAEYFMPTKLTTADSTDTDHTRVANRYLQALESHRQPLIQIPLADYLAIEPEDWVGIGERVDAAQGIDQTRGEVLAFNGAAKNVAARLI